MSRMVPEIKTWSSCHRWFRYKIRQHMYYISSMNRLYSVGEKGGGVERPFYVRWLPPAAATVKLFWAKVYEQLIPCFVEHYFSAKSSPHFDACLTDFFNGPNFSKKNL